MSSDDKAMQTALAYFNNGKYDETIAELDKVIVSDPNNKMAYYQKGVALFRLEKYYDARSAFYKATQIDKSFWQAFREYGFTSYTASFKEDKPYITIDQAIEAYQIAIGLCPGCDNAMDKDYVKTLLRASDIYDNPSYRDLALVHAESILANDPGNVDWWIIKGQIYEKSGDINRAGAAYIQAQKLDPTNTLAEYYYGRLYKVDRSSSGSTSYSSDICANARSGSATGKACELAGGSGSWD